MFNSNSYVRTSNRSDPENASLPVETYAIEEGQESSASRGKQAFDTLQSSNTDIVGKDSNKHIENSSLPATTPALNTQVQK